jgi:hypothetical protein
MEVQVKKYYIPCWAVALCAALAMPVVQAQSNTASIFGRVMDQSNAAIPGAEVTATNEDTSSSQTAITGDVGGFSITYLQVGTYTLAIAMPGFKTKKETGLALAASDKLNLTFRLEVGDVSDFVQVTAAQPLVESSTAQHSVAITKEQVVQLPLFKRDLGQILHLGTGTHIGGKYTDTFTINGLAPASHTVNLDGVDASRQGEQSSISGKFGYNLIRGTTLEAVKEVKVSKGSMTAEVAKTFSGSLNIITKNGTNDLHGSLFYNYNSAGLNARNRRSFSKLPLVFNQFGGSVGGPLVKDQAFFFFAYEGYRQTEAALIQGDVPTAEFRAAAVAQQPAFAPFFDLYALPNQPQISPTDITALFIGDGPRTFNENYFIFRGDVNVGEAGVLTGRFARSEPSRLQPRYPSQVNQSGNAKQWYASYVHGGTSFTSESRFGFNDNSPSVLYQEFPVGADADAFLANPVSVRFNQFGVSGQQIRNESQSWTAEEVVAFNHGDHSIKIGGRLGNLSTNEGNIWTSTYNYDTEAEFFANVPSQVSVVFGKDDYDLGRYDGGFFIQDDWRATPRLMLNLGVRYDIFGVPKERDGRLFNYDSAFSTTLRDPDSIFDGDFNNISPRLGFAYRLDDEGRTVIRGGGGVYFTPVPSIQMQQLVLNKSANAPGFVPATFRFNGEEALALGIQYPMGAADIAPLLSGLGRPAIWHMDPDTRTPYAMSWNLSIQRQLTDTMAWEIGYVGNGSRKVSLYNTANMQRRDTGLRATDLIPGMEGIGGFRMIDDADSTTYHALQTEFKKRFSNYNTFNMYYDWSNNISYFGGDLFRGDRIQDWDLVDSAHSRLDLERGPTRHRIRHRFVMDHIVELPFGKWANSPGSRRALEGWTLGGIWQWMSGEGGDGYLISQGGPGGGRRQRPDFTCGSHQEAFDTAPAGKLFNPGCFSMVGINSIGQFDRPGTYSRYPWEYPRRFNWDLSLAKKTQLGEGIGLEIRADLINAFNNVAVSRARTGPGSCSAAAVGTTDETLDGPGCTRAGNFGDIRSLTNSRQVQFNMRLTF